MLLLLILFSIASVLNANLDLYSTDNTHIVVCNETMPCAGDIVTDCNELDKPCIIDCTNTGVSICKDAEFICHPNQDCTLICDSTNSPKACWGTILNASLSNNINVNIECINFRACEYLIIDTISSHNINLNITIYDKTNAQIPQYIAKHSEIYLPQSGNTNTHINCIGHSSCDSINIYGNTSDLTHISTLNINNIGQHSFKDSYISFPSNSNINILCNHTESCFASTFDGAIYGINSNINIECNGNNSCMDTYIIANNKSKSLIINANYGYKSLSNSNIFCPINICDIIVNAYYNGINMLLNTHIFANNKVNIECNNCNNNETGPMIYCNNNANDTCQLMLINNELKCANDKILSCLLYDLSDSNSFSFSFDEFETTFIFYDDESIRDDLVGLMHNTKGQIVLTTIISVLLLLCVLVCIVKKQSIKQFIQNPCADDENDFIQGVSIKQYDVMRIPNTNNINKKGKNKYEVLEESYSINDHDESEIMISDPTDEDDQSDP